MTIEVATANFLLKYLAEIILGLVVVLISALQLLGRRAQADAIKTSLAAPPVTKVEMLEHQMETATLIRAEFDKLRSELRDELKTLWSSVDELRAKGP